MPHKDPEKKKAHNKIYNEAHKEEKKAYNKIYNEAHKEEKRDHDKTYREANKEKIRAAAATHYEANREERMAKMRANYEANKEERRSYAKAYREANKEKIGAYREANKENSKAYYEANREEHRARNAKRQASKIQATLPTTDGELIKNLYKRRAAMAKEHGEEYHVDHIIPLSIGGAHHQDNMRVITAKENLEKNAKYIPKLGGVWADNKLALKNRKKYKAL